MRPKAHIAKRREKVDGFEFRPQPSIDQTDEVVGILEKEEHSEIRHKAYDQEEVLPAFGYSLEYGISAPVIDECAEYEYPKVQVS